MASQSRRGGTLVIITLLLPVVLAIAAYSINVVYMEVTRTELQIATDVSARAAARVLAVTGDQHQARRVAEQLMGVNPVAGQTLTSKSTEVVFGVSSRTSESQRYSFVPGGLFPNAVQIRTNGSMQVPMLFPTLGVPVDFRPFKTAIVTQSELDISIVVDRSGSMAYSTWEVTNTESLPRTAKKGWVFGLEIPAESRWLDACDAVSYFLTLLERSSHSELVSLTSYSTVGVLDVPLTANYDLIRNRLGLHSRYFVGGSTNIGHGIMLGASSLGVRGVTRPWTSRVMILLTDGIHNGGIDPLEAAAIAADEHITIYTITFSDEADTATMKEIADSSGGSHFHAVDAKGLEAAFKSISDRLPMLLTY